MRAICALVLFSLAFPAISQERKADSSAFQSTFQQAYADYQAGSFAQAATRLQQLAVEKPNSFDVHELLGLSYAAEREKLRAVDELRQAVHLAPDTVSARNNLATSLMQADRSVEAEAQWHVALRLDPKDYTANRNLARLYLQRNDCKAALPLLEAARQEKEGAADNTYDLALAYQATGNPDRARNAAEDLLRHNNTGQAHVLLGRLDEQQGRYVEAATQFSEAAHLDPSDDNLFAWASELMAHRAYEAAIAVFREGTRRYPLSPRLWVGQGMALYSRGEYQESVSALLKATDLDAQDARAYVFLSKAFLSSPTQAEAVIERFHRYALLKPNDATAQFDYAIALWKGRRVNTPEIDYPAVEALMQRSIALDGSNAESHLQLGVLYADQHLYGPAQAEFQRAVKLDPGLADAHFRLGRAYLRAGESEKAQGELNQFKQLQAQHQAALDKERASVELFVVATQRAAAERPVQPSAEGDRP